MQRVLSRGFTRRFGSKQFSQIAYRKNFNLFVGGLSYDTNESALHEAFSRHGEVISANVICDRVSGKSNGFGFVKFADEGDAMRALREMHGQLLDGRSIRVERAKNFGVDFMQSNQDRGQREDEHGDSHKVNA